MGIDNNIKAKAAEASAPRHPLPPLPKKLAWPKPRIPDVPDKQRKDDDYDRSEHFNRWGGLKAYLAEVFPAPLLSHIDMPTFRANWPKAGRAVDQQRAKLESKGFVLPVLKPELIDRELRQEWIAAKDISRLSRAQQRRNAKAKQQVLPGFNIT